MPSKYTTEWLHDVRLQHSNDVAASKLKRIDYEHIEKVLLMRRDLLESWARRLHGPLNAFDMFILSLDMVNSHENVAKIVAKETDCFVSPPSWLTQDKAVFLRERYRQLISSSVDYSRASFEDFQEDSDERTQFIRDLIKTSNGQIELGMFLGKGLIAKDDDHYRLALEYLISVMPFFEQFPQVIDAIIIGISNGSDIRKCCLTGQAVCAILTKHSNLAVKLADRLMEGIQRDHLVINRSSPSQLALCYSSEFSLRLTKCLPIWLIVLGSCLVSTHSDTESSLYNQIDLLLLLPIECEDPDDAGMICEWLRALITVFSIDKENDETLRNCAKRFLQLIELEKKIEIAKVDCGEPTRALIAELLDVGLNVVTLATCSECSNEPVCQLTPNVLSLLNLNYEPIREEEEEEGEGGKGKEKQDKLRLDKVYDRIIDLMNEWIKLGIEFDASQILRLIQHSESKALKLAFAYEKKFGVFPLDSCSMGKLKELEPQLLSLLSTDDSNLLGQLIESSPEEQLRRHQEVVTKLLTKHPRVISNLINRFPDSTWTVKVAWSSIITAIESLKDLSETLECLINTKSLIDYCVNKKDNVELLIILIRNMKSLLNFFEEKCLPSLSTEFGTKTQIVLSILKCLQSCTRPVQSVCASSKSTIPELANQVPALKKSLESVLFKVKILLNDNDCLSAFWMGNLKDKSTSQ